jgi:hypothetical protein
MSLSKTNISSMEVDVPLRRSARIAKLHETQQKQQITTPPINKTTQKRVSSVSKKAKASPKKLEKVMKEYVKQLPKFDNIKINDVFKLVKTYAKNESERKLVYSVLQHIVKNTKNLHINNLIKDVYDNRADVIAFVCASMQLSFETVDDILDTILSYEEIRDSQVQKASNTTKSDLDFIIQSLSTIKL